jgi:hypothetical protein
MIYVTIDHGYVELITDTHRSMFPVVSSGSDRAYDWIVFKKRTDEALPTIGSGTCEWQHCGYREYSDDLPENLIAGMTAWEIRNRLDEFMTDPCGFLKALNANTEFTVSII